MFENDRKNDGLSTLASVEALVLQLQEWFSSCESWVLQTDNGPCYKGNLFLQGLLNLNKVYRLQLSVFVNSGVQDGKTYLDGHFGVLTQGLVRRMVIIGDMNSPITLVQALVKLAPANCIIRMITTNLAAT